MLTEAQIEEVKEHPGIGWVTALRASAIQKLAAKGCVQMSLFDERNLAEVRSPEYLGERLVVCLLCRIPDPGSRKMQTSHHAGNGKDAPNPEL